jgi:hypothetical protein
LARALNEDCASPAWPLTISPQACPEFAKRHTWEASACAVENITNVRAEGRKAMRYNFAVKGPRRA